MRSVGKYQIIGPHSEQRQSAPPDVLILDNCVAIDIQKFYFERNFSGRESLRSLLLEFPIHKFGSTKTDINYGWASGQSLVLRSGELREYETRELRHAVERVLSWTPVEVEDNFSRRHPPVSRDRDWPRNAIPLTADDINDNFPLMCASYTALLYVLKLETERSKWKHRGSQYIINHLHEWMRSSLGVTLSYEFAVAVDLLACKGKRHSQARKLLHYGGDKNPDKLADSAWSAAWDVWFLRLPEGASYGLLPGAKTQVTHLVTADKDPAYLRSISELNVMFDAGDSQVVYHRSNWDDLEFITPVDMGRIVTTDPLDDYARSRRNPKELALQIVKTLDDLEAELKVESRTVTDERRRFFATTS